MRGLQSKMNLQIDGQNSVEINVFSQDYEKKVLSRSEDSYRWNREARLLYAFSDFLQSRALPLMGKDSTFKVYSLPQLVQLLVDTSYASPLWAARRLIAVNSVESCVWNGKLPTAEKIEAVLGDKNQHEIPLEDILIIMHGDNHLIRSLRRSEDTLCYVARGDGLISYHDTPGLLKGKFFGEDIAVFDYEQFLKESRQPAFEKQFPRYVVVLPASVFRSANKGEHIDALAEDPLFIVRNGGERLARAHIDKIKGMASHFEKESFGFKMRYYDLEIEQFENEFSIVDPFSFDNCPAYNDWPKPKILKQPTQPWREKSVVMPIVSEFDSSFIMGLANEGVDRGFLPKNSLGYGSGLVTGTFCPFEQHRKNEEKKAKVQGNIKNALAFLKKLKDKVSC